VDTRVISQDGFISVPFPHAPLQTKTTTKTVTQSSSEPSITHVKRIIDSLQNEINALKQRQQATDETIRNNPLHTLFEKQNSQAHALDIKMSQYMKDQYQGHVDLQTSIQDKCKADWNHIWSIQRRESQHQPNFTYDSIFSQYQNNLMQKIEDRLHKHLQLVSNQYQTLENMHKYKKNKVNGR